MARSYHILIAEDNADQRDFLVHLIARQYPSATVHTVVDGRDALAYYLAQGADLIIADQRMPEMSGSDLIQHVRALPSTVPIVLLSALIASGMIANDTHLYYLQKPINAQDLAAVFQALLEA